MVTLKASTKSAAMYYLKEAVKEAKYNLNCYTEGTQEYLKEKKRYESLNALLLSMENIAENIVL